MGSLLTPQKILKTFYVKIGAFSVEFCPCGRQPLVGVELSVVRVEAADLPEGAGAERAVEVGGLGVDPPDVRPQVAHLREPDGAEVALVGLLPAVLPGVQHQRVLLAGAQFKRQNFGLSFGLKIHLSFGLRSLPTPE